MQYAFTFLPGLVIGRLFDRGYLHLPLLIGSVMLAVCTLLVAECTVYWQFLLCQGFAVGVRPTGPRVFPPPKPSYELTASVDLLRHGLRAGGRRRRALVQEAQGPRARSYGVWIEHGRNGVPCYSAEAH